MKTKKLTRTKLKTELKGSNLKMPHGYEIVVRKKRITKKRK